MMNKKQQAVLDSYQNGEYAYVTSESQLRKVGDGLISFVVREISDHVELPAYECIRRLKAARDEVDDAITALIAAFPDELVDPDAQKDGDEDTHNEHTAATP